MTQAWGSATENKGGGGGADPHVVKLGEQTRVRILDGEGPRKWRQHNLRGEDLHKIFPEVDAQAFRSVNCPRGADGMGSAPCPLDMKPSFIDEDGKIGQLFPVSIRYATNVWDYETGSVKILIGGKQIFAEFDATAKAGFDPTASDFMIVKLGKDRQTSYKVVRGGSDPLPREIKPEELHDLDKYERPDSAERIFEILVELGVDYDAIELPSFELDDANQFVMPYTKYKGMTMEQLAATDLDFMKWLYGEKRSQGQYGDAVFQAMHSVLLSMGETTPITDVIKAPPRAAIKAAPKTPLTAALDAASDQVTLIGPDGALGQFPAGAKAGLLAAGFKEPAPEPKNEPTEEGIVTLVGPDGNEIEIQRGSMDALLAAGFTVKATGEKAPEPVLLTPPGGGDPIDVRDMPDAAIAAMLQQGFLPVGAHADDDEVAININGAITTMKYGVAKTIIESGAATLVEA